MMKLKELIIVLGSILSLTTFSSVATAQEPIPYHKEPFIVDTSAQENLGTQGAHAFREVVRSPDVPWLQLHFSDYNLGQQSYITITSLQDGGQQRLDAQSLPLWRNSSAYFNGDTVEVVLHVAPSETAIFFRIDEITVGEWVGQVNTVQTEDIEPQEICGTTDDRVASNHAAVGRIMPTGCTGWMISNGGNLTAGHCVGTDQILEFNVPASESDGTPVNPPPQDQYPITAYTGSTNGGLGNDWAVFRTGANSNDETAIERQGSFFRMSRDLTPTIVREIGYGIDGPSPLFGDGPRNSDSQTQQTDTGAFVSETIVGPNDVEIRFTIDDENGNSGSPVVDTGVLGDVTIGIATNAGCTATGGSNGGTGFENNGLENAIQTFPGTNVVYVDQGHPIGLEDGTVFRPHNTVLEGINNASSGTILDIVAGFYNETMTIDKPLTMQAPVGVVTIGN